MPCGHNLHQKPQIKKFCGCTTGAFCNLQLPRRIIQTFPKPGQKQFMLKHTILADVTHGDAASLVLQYLSKRCGIGGLQKRTARVILKNDTTQGYTTNLLLHQ